MVDESNRPDSEELISAYLDGELTESEREHVDALLREDDHSRELFEQFQLLRETLRQLPRHNPDEDFAAAILNRVRESHQASPASVAPSQPSGFRRGLIWSIAAIATVLLLSLFITQPLVRMAQSPTGNQDRSVTLSRQENLTNESPARQQAAGGRPDLASSAIESYDAPIPDEMEQDSFEIEGLDDRMYRSDERSTSDAPLPRIAVPSAPAPGGPVPSVPEPESAAPEVPEAPVDSSADDDATDAYIAPEVPSASVAESALNEAVDDPNVETDAESSSVDQFSWIQVEVTPERWPDMMQQLRRPPLRLVGWRVDEGDATDPLTRRSRRFLRRSNLSRFRDRKIPRRVSGSWWTAPKRRRS